MQSRTIEIWVGFFVALGLAALFMLAMQVSNLANVQTDNGYQISANFDNIGGLKVKSPVKVGGVKVGQVSEISYDDEVYQAVVTMTIDSQYQRLPADTSASIFTAGLLGAQYIGLEVGADEEFLADGDELFITQSAVILEQLIGQFLYNTAAKGSDDSGSE
ncbi:outer membrane lipid asymmetry maintenance protein MlaD [Candidatus Albibeggiatoa sp. nov. NOAA]|uniref:outer membrane lipid asymmetry maintenance protein MlaD n=1 Tax=Candidatus Albibeggiatoa sp. nov. NOAA TaxID=3162724 RepID=UPI003305523F|nr:outer membrane lipid asymmetry maintenance protein MlaD [Thiotrichaceae bacterium]